MKKLHEQLQTVGGKKVYGYLPQDVKRTVDDILAELAKDKQVSQLYKKWCELERLKHKIYTQREPELPPLADNRVFKPVKNMIIRAVLEMRTEPILSEIEIPMEADDTLSPEDFTWNPDGVFETEIESSELTIEDEIDRLKVLADQGKSYASYKLGKIYLFSADGIGRDVQQAGQWLTKSAEGGNEYAQQLLDNMEQRENAAFASTIFRLFVSLGHAIEDDYNKSHKKLQSKVDSKIQRMIRKHKQELGIRDEHDMTMA